MSVQGREHQVWPDTGLQPGGWQGLRRQRGDRWVQRLERRPGCLLGRRCEPARHRRDRAAFGSVWWWTSQSSIMDAGRSLSGPNDEPSARRSRRRGALPRTARSRTERPWQTHRRHDHRQRSRTPAGRRAGRRRRHWCASRNTARRHERLGRSIPHRFARVRSIRGWLREPAPRLARGHAVTARGESHGSTGRIARSRVAPPRSCARRCAWALRSPPTPA